MREILFRGKREDTNEWVYEYLSKSRNVMGKLQICIDYEENGVMCSSLVFCDTVGQYTGLTDKNGKKIFEGDIAQFKRFEDSYVGKIVFNQNTAGFEFWWNITVGAYGEKATHKANLSVCDEIEIIGNIYDNPELLEGEQ